MSAWTWLLRNRVRAFHTIRRYGPQFTIGFFQAGCLTHFFIRYVACVQSSEGSSMYPTIRYKGDKLWVVRFNSPLLRHLTRPLERGDFVVAYSPIQPGVSIGKRVIGLPNDVIWLDPSGTATTTVNDDEEEDEEEQDSEAARVWIRVPKGHVWVEGDNPANSRDSRTYGPLPIALIYGRALFRFRTDVRGPFSR